MKIEVRNNIWCVKSLFNINGIFDKTEDKLHFNRTKPNLYVNPLVFLKFNDISHIYMSQNGGNTRYLKMSYLRRQG